MQRALENTFYVMFLAFYAPKMLKMGLGPLSSLDCAMIPNTIVSPIIEFLITGGPLLFETLEKQPCKQKTV